MPRGAFEGFAVRIKGRDHALREKSNVGAIITEVVVRFKVGEGVFMIEGTCHDAPGDGVTCLRSEVEEAFGLNGEDAFVAGKADVEGAFGAFEAEARALAAGDEECGDGSLCKKESAGFFPHFVAVIFFGDCEGHGRGDVWGGVCEECA